MNILKNKRKNIAFKLHFATMDYKRGIFCQKLTEN